MNHSVYQTPKYKDPFNTTHSFGAAFNWVPYKEPKFNKVDYVRPAFLEGSFMIIFSAELVFQKQ